MDRLASRSTHDRRAAFSDRLRCAESISTTSLAHPGQFQSMPTGSPEATDAHCASTRAAPGLLRRMLKPAIVKPALKVSLVVGTALNVINNGQHLWASHGVSLWQVALNFVVPFLVSSYSAANNEAKRARGQ